MKKIAKEKQIRRNRRLRFVVGFVLILVSFLAAAQLFVSNRLADLGEEMERAKHETDLLIAKNRILDEETRGKGSLVNIAVEAKKLGFVESKLIYYLIPQIPVAMK